MSDQVKFTGKIVTVNFTILFFVVFMLFFTHDFYIPVLPFYVLDNGGTETTVGLLMGVFTLCAVLLRPFQGRNLNRSGRKRLLVTGILLYTVAGMGLLLQPALPLLFIFRAIQGFGWGSFLLAFNTLALDMAPADRRGETVGLMGNAPPVSLATAPLLGEYYRIASGGNYLALFMVVAVIAFATLLLSTFTKEPYCGKKAKQSSVLIFRPVLWPSLIIFFMTFSFGSILTFLPLLGAARNLPVIGSFFTVFALTTMVSRPVAGRLSDRLGRPQVFIPALIINTGSLVMIATAFTVPLLLGAALVFGVGFGAAHSSVLGLAADRLPEAQRGVGMGTFTSAFDLGIVAGSVSLGLLLNWFDFTALFVLCAMIMLLPVFFYFGRTRLSGLMKVS